MKYLSVLSTSVYKYSWESWVGEMHTYFCVLPSALQSSQHRLRYQLDILRYFTPALRQRN